MKHFSRAASLSVCILFSACSLGPDYERPLTDTPPKYLEAGADHVIEVANLPWWKLFRDETLQNLIRVALAENKDIAVALARIEAARASLKFTRADQFPRLDGSGGAERFDPSDESLNFAVDPRNNFGLFGDLSFEIDLWGKLRRATEAERAQLLATEYAHRGVVISLVAEVAKTYFTILGLDNRLAISRVTLVNRKDATNIIGERFKKGVIPELDVNQAEIEEADAAIAISAFERQLLQNENALNVLLGNTPAKTPRGLALENQTLQIPAAMPASLLERRPDVRVSEEVLKARVARIGVAQAERLPSVNLLGFVGLQSDDTSDLFDGDAFTWSIGGDFLGPIIDFGKSRARVDVAKAEAQASLKNYEQTVIQAVREVEDAMVGIRTYNQEFASRSKQVASARNAARLSRARYDQGVTSYLEVLDIERSLFEAELGASETYERYFQAIIDLFKALGGGWEEA